MRVTIPRRSFLEAAGYLSCGALLAPSLVRPASAVPDSLDHILLGCDDLDRGISFVEQRTGVRAALGGVHPGRGTRNALLALGGRRYLEIIAPDPQQEVSPMSRKLKELSEPRLMGWAAHSPDAAALAKRLGEAGIASQGPTDGSRLRPDGRTLRWRTVSLEEDHGGLLPFFIEWSKDTVHPSVDAPAGCRLSHFGAVSPDPGELASACRRVEIEIAIAHGEKPGLRARLTGPRGEFAAAS